MKPHQRIKQLEKQIKGYKGFLKELPYELTFTHSQSIQREIDRLDAQIYDLQALEPHTKITFHKIEIKSNLNYISAEIRLTPEEKNELLKQAISRGFIPGAMFTSATGVKGCRIKEKLVVKDNGDIVVKSAEVGEGYFGCVYCTELKKWGEIYKKA